MALYGKVNLGGGSKSKGLAPENVSNLVITSHNGSLTITWTDPNDTVINGQTIATWKGTKIVYKQDSYPVDENDGIIAVTNEVRNQYAEEGFNVPNLINNTTYYFQAFPYSNTDRVNTNEANRATGTPYPYKIMTAIIDQTNSNPDTCITYQDDASTMSAKSTEWDDFFGVRPCLFKDGKVVGYLQKNDFTKFEDGTTADITSGDMGDVMIEFPRRGLRISNQNDETITVSMTEDSDDPNFQYYAHNRGYTKKDKLYIGAYLGFNQDNKLRSLSGKTPTTSITIDNFRTLAQANGTNSNTYDLVAFYQLTLLQAMFILKYKSLNSQTALGTGYGYNKGIKLNTGGTETWGMNCELIQTTNPTYLNDDKHHMKVFGIEDLWGNLNQYLDGLYVSSSRYIQTNTTDFNSTGYSYKYTGTQFTKSTMNGFISKSIGTSKDGFIAKEAQGSSTTYYCDNTSITADRLAAFGGKYYSSSNGGNGYGGIFYLNIGFTNASQYGNYGARLMYL